MASNHKRGEGSLWTVAPVKEEERSREEGLHKITQANRMYRKDYRKLYQDGIPKIIKAKRGRKRLHKIIQANGSGEKIQHKLCRLPKWKQRITQNNPD